jgi:coproporphyrinogen III oxidase, anaerobic (EC 1.3.99.22)
MQGALFGGGRTVEQLHFGGGTPTFLDADQLGGLMEHLARHFPLTNAPDREYSIEIDPRSVGTDAPARLAAMGFNRMSLGVQDFDPEVQRAVNRVQPVTQTLRLIESARSRDSARSASI